MRKPKIVCLCGSTRFERAFHAVNERETFAGNIVLSCGVFKTTLDGRRLTIEEEDALEEAHLSKVMMADEVIFINCGGYLGERAQFELKMAQEAGKAIRFLEPPQPQAEEVGVRVSEMPEQLAEIQAFYKRLCVKAGWDNETAEQCIGLLAEELGELSKAVRTRCGIGNELADVFHYLLTLANICEIDLLAASAHKIEVIKKREGLVGSE